MTADGDALDDATLERMIAAIDEEWTLADATEIERGGSLTYGVTVATGDGTLDCVLKAEDDYASGELSAEARLTCLVGAETPVPVPEVHGVVDDHPDLPTPFFLLERVAGEDLPADESEVPVDVRAGIAQDLGRSIGAVHALDAFDGFGPIVAARDVDPETAGGTRPLAREYGLTIPDPEPPDAWDERFDGIVDRLCDRLAEGRFADLAPRLRTTLIDRAAGLDLSGPPAIARIDHNLENVVTDGDGSIAGVLDWELARTTHREYDLACAEQGLCGTAPLGSDQRERLRAALYAGYGATNEVPADDAFPARRRLYLLTFHVASMCWAEGWLSSQAPAVEREFRELAAALA